MNEVIQKMHISTQARSTAVGSSCCHYNSGQNMNHLLFVRCCVNIVCEESGYFTAVILIIQNTYGQQQICITKIDNTTY